MFLVCSAGLGQAWYFWWSSLTTEIFLVKLINKDKLLVKSENLHTHTLLLTSVCCFQRGSSFHLCVSTGHSSVRQGFWTLQLHRQKQHRRSIPGVYISTGRCVCLPVTSRRNTTLLLNPLFASDTCSWSLKNIHSFVWICVYPDLFSLCKYLLTVCKLHDVFWDADEAWLCSWKDLRVCLVWDETEGSPEKLVCIWFKLVVMC